jgi:hypothetical protein
MQQVVDTSCEYQGMPLFEVTLTQVTAFKNFCFAGSSYFDIGLGLLPFSTDANPSADRAMLDADRGRSDAFDIGANP